jgi:HemY protein
MRAVVWAVLLFVVAVVAATTLGTNDGLVSVAWGGWRADLSLNLFILVVLGACFLIMGATRAIDSLLTLPTRAAEWRALQRERAAQRALREAHLEFDAARYLRAQRAAEKVLGFSRAWPPIPEADELSLMALLMLASSLHRLQDREGRQRALDEALALAGRVKGRPGAEAPLLRAAEWALEDRDATLAHQWLDALPPGAARRTHALRLRLQAARLSGQHAEALKTARLLAKHQAFPTTATPGLLRSLCMQVLDASHDAEQLRQAWLALEPADRRDALLVAHACRRAAGLGAAADGRNWARPFWDRLSELSEQERSALALALCDSLDGVGSEWLAPMEKALAHGPAGPGDAGVSAAAGMTFAARGLWGLAAAPLERAARAADLPGHVRRRAWRLLAQAAQGAGDDHRAADCEREASRID